MERDREVCGKFRAVQAAEAKEEEGGDGVEGGESRVTWLPLKGPCWLAQELTIGLPGDIFSFPDYRFPLDSRCGCRLGTGNELAVRILDVERRLRVEMKDPESSELFCAIILISCFEYIWIKTQPQVF